MLLKNLMTHMRQRLSAAGYPPGEARSVALIIIDRLLHFTPSQVIINAETDIDPLYVTGADKIIDRVAKGEPVQYVLGEARFYGMDFEVSPAVLIPRQETEELVDLIVRENPGKDLRVLDLGTGSGCIAIALSRFLKFAEVTAVDISGEALEVAQRNAARLKADVRFIHADMFNELPIDIPFDIIVSNPPYICEKEKADMEPLVLDHEPHRALFVPDNDPLKFYRRIADIAADSLTVDGHLYLEINPIYCHSLIEMLTRKGFSDVTPVDDISGRQRFITAIRPALF